MDFDLDMETKNVVVKKKIRWTVKDLSYMPSKLESSVFCPVEGSSSKWMFQLHYRRYNSIKICLDILVNKDSFPLEIFNVKGLISLKTAAGEVCLKDRPFETVVTCSSFSECLDYCCYPNSCNLDNKSVTNVFDLPDDVLIIEFSLTISRPVTKIVPNYHMLDIEEKPGRSGGI